MSMMMYLSFRGYRISINSSILVDTAKEILSKSHKEADLKTVLSYDPEDALPPMVKAGIAPQKNARDLLRMLKENKRRAALKAKRQKRGFANFLQPRKGLKGLIQKLFFDGPERKLTNEFDILEWLHIPRSMRSTRVDVGMRKGRRCLIQRFG